MKVLLSLLLLLSAPGALAATAGAAAGPVEGRDYVRVEAGPWQPVDGKIEVVEVFAYTCPHCADFEPILSAWARKLPDDVSFRYLPAAFDPRDAYARGFFVAEQAGAVGRTHAALFQAIHQDGLLARNATINELAWFYGQHGLDQAQARAAMASPQVDALMRRAYEWARANRLPGTPALVVDGRYLVTPRTHADALRIVDELIAQIRKTR